MITQTDVDRLVQTSKNFLGKYEQRHQAVLCKLGAEGLTIFSDWPDIEAVLEKTVAPTACIRSAHQMRDNPFSPRREAAEAALKRVEGEQETFEGGTIPGTFVMGRSGVTKAYRRKLDAQLDKTIALAVRVVKAQETVTRLVQQEKLFDLGLINYQGRSISDMPEPKKRGPHSDKVKTIRKAMLALSIDGECWLPTDHILSVWQQWVPEERELDGIIRVTDPDGTSVDHRAASIQGVDLERMQLLLLNEILSERPISAQTEKIALTTKLAYLEGRLCYEVGLMKMSDESTRADIPEGYDVTFLYTPDKKRVCVAAGDALGAILEKQKSARYLGVAAYAEDGIGHYEWEPKHE